MVQLFMKIYRRSFLVTLTILVIAAIGCGAEKKRPMKQLKTLGYLN